MNFWKTLILVALGITVVILLSRLVYHVRMAQYEVHGVDVSRYQETVDWQAVEKNCQFAFIKATEGTNVADPYFKNHWQQLRSRRLKRGAYHFFLPAADARQQARHFIRNVTLQKGDLPPVLDVEVTQRQSAAQITRGVKQWLSFVEGHYGIRPIVYTNYAFYRQYLQRKLKHYPIWIAYYGFRTPQTEPAWHFWQYSDRGSMAGISTRVDVNVFRGSREELDRICMP